MAIALPYKAETFLKNSNSKLEKLFWKEQVNAILVLEWKKTLEQVAIMQCAVMADSLPELSKVEP